MDPTRLLEVRDHLDQALTALDTSLDHAPTQLVARHVDVVVHLRHAAFELRWLVEAARTTP